MFQRGGRDVGGLAQDAQHPFDAGPFVHARQEVVREVEAYAVDVGHMGGEALEAGAGPVAAAGSGRTESMRTTVSTSCPAAVRRRAVSWATKPPKDQPPSRYGPRGYAARMASA